MVGLVAIIIRAQHKSLDTCPIVGHNTFMVETNNKSTATDEAGYDWAIFNDGGMVEGGLGSVIARQNEYQQDV